MNKILESLPKADVAHRESNVDFFLLGNPHYVTTRPHYGGRRLWLVCPSCGARVRILYQLNGQMICRRCVKWPYHLQTVNATSPVNLLLRLEHLSRKFQFEAAKKYRLFHNDRFTRQVQKLLKIKSNIQKYYNDYAKRK